MKNKIIFERGSFYFIWMGYGEGGVFVFLCPPLAQKTRQLRILLWAREWIRHHPSKSFRKSVGRVQKSDFWGGSILRESFNYKCVPISENCYAMVCCVSATHGMVWSFFEYPTSVFRKLIFKNSFSLSIIFMGFGGKQIFFSSEIFVILRVNVSLSNAGDNCTKMHNHSEKLKFC